MNLTSFAGFAIDQQRLLIAAAAIIIYACMCLAIARGQLAKRRSTALLRTKDAGLDDANPHWHIAYASQTSTAEELARQTTNTLHLSGIAVQMSTLSELDANVLSRAERILFIVSTYGEGNPPDNAAAFAQRLMGTELPLGHLHYSLLALGDRSYANFCGFGRDLDRWLQAQGAQAIFPAIEVHQCNPDAIDTWRQQLSHLAGTDDAPDWQGPAYDQWQIADRRQLNPGSEGGEVFHIELEPAAGVPLPVWESGDLAQILVPTDTERPTQPMVQQVKQQPREYSIASIPGDGRVHLLVRLHHHPDGSFGAASGWLNKIAKIGDKTQLRLRPHPRFRLGDNAHRPLILIGNGTGIAGLRGHLKARAAHYVHSSAQRNWLIFGERNSCCDYHYREEIEAWQTSGVLERLDMVFSRDQPDKNSRHYVQDRLLEAGDTLRNWIAQGAAIYVCGSLKGMASGVDDALAQILGRQALEELSLAGRYRRDVY